MNRSKIALAVSWLAIAVTTLPLHAGMTNDETGNPFRVIVASNVFRLRPPVPERDSPRPDPQPLPPLAQVMLTGIHTVFGPPQALFEITETASGKPSVNRPILREGEGMGSVQVLAIDVVKNVVRIKNGTVETNLTFDPLRQTAPPAMASAVPLPVLNKLLPPALPPAHGG